MCILATATKGAQFSRSTLEAMFYANSDGAGWAYAKDGKIYFSKGYTSANKFIKAVQKLPLDCERMVHCRIATHGGVCKGLTHPFPISRDYGKMEMLSGVLSSGYILAHNGILSNFTPPQNHSDTEELVRCLANLKCDVMGEDMRELINTLVTGSRVAILNTDGKINRYGTGWTQLDGIWYSNLYFRNYAYDDDWDDWRYYYNNYRSYKSDANESTSTTESAEPKLSDLEMIAEGEVIKMTKTKTAYINATEGTYLRDKNTNKLYGQYHGTLYPTTYEMCDTYDCCTCTYTCPFKN